MSSDKKQIKKLQAQLVVQVAENKRQKKALDIAIGYIKDGSRRTLIGQLYDIEQAQKG